MSVSTPITSPMSAAVAEGLEGVVVTATTLSDVRGTEGKLILRGRPLEALASAGRFEDAVAHLVADLWPGLTDVGKVLASGRKRAEDVLPVLSAADLGLPVYEMMQLGLAALPVGDELHPLELAGALPVFLANGFRLKSGLGLMAPDPALPVAADLLRMIHGAQAPQSHVDGLDRYLTTVLDHGLNASTFAARVIASTGAAPKAGLLGAMGALSGPLHGGAPGPVLDMLDAAEASGDVAGWIGQELAAGRRLMGFGHRIYRTRDPRADVLKQGLSRLSAETGRLRLAETVEREALAALKRAKPDRVLETNVEFYTAVLLEAIGFDRGLFTPLFAVGRSAGWCAHMAEQQAKGRLIRPQSIYVGP